jgi:cytochrome bd-type quinol oxidase subunit 2
MTTRTMVHKEAKTTIKRNDWVKIGLKTALFSVIAVLIVQAVALAIWPEVRVFKPLDSYPRSALFTLVPAIVATAVFAWLARHQPQPVKKFVILSVVLLLLSFIPDYALPLEGKTLLGSSVAAFMHLVASVVTVATIVTSYRNRAA